MNTGYPQLLREMKARGVKVKDLQNLLNINRQALSFKLHGKRNARFTVEQAICIKKVFFPDISIETLFEKEHNGTDFVAETQSQYRKAMLVYDTGKLIEEFRSTIDDILQAKREKG